MHEHTIPESLIEQIRTGRAALVVGAGIGVPSWKQMLERMTKALETVIVDQNLLTADGLGALRGAFQRVVVSTQRHPPAHRTSVLIQRNRRSLT